MGKYVDLHLFMHLSFFLFFHLRSFLGVQVTAGRDSNNLVLKVSPGIYRNLASAFQPGSSYPRWVG